MKNKLDLRIAIFPMKQYILNTSYLDLLMRCCMFNQTMNWSNTKGNELYIQFVKPEHRTKYGSHKKKWQRVENQKYSLARKVLNYIYPI